MLMEDLCFYLPVCQVYGGYVTSLLLSAEDSLVKCGAALSPITDFDLYGKICVPLWCQTDAVSVNHTSTILPWYQHHLT